MTVGDVVMIHGTWHGGWCWAQVASLLGEKGWRVLHPSLAGCSDRAHLLGPSLSIAVMAADLLAAVEAAGMKRFTLVAHSSGGMVASDLVRIARNRIDRVVLLDAVVPLAGEAGFDAYPDEDRRWRIAHAARLRDCAVIPVPDELPEVWGLADARFGWVRGRLAPHPMAAFTTPAAGWGRGGGREPPVTYVSCNRPPHPILDVSKRRVRARPHWAWIDVDEPHDCMLTNPALTAELVACASGRAQQEPGDAIGPGGCC